MIGWNVKQTLETEHMTELVETVFEKTPKKNGKKWKNTENSIVFNEFPNWLEYREVLQLIRRQEK